MNTKRIAFWVVFVVILGLIVWGMVAAMNKSASRGPGEVGTPAPITAADHVRGPADAPVTLIEYSDFQCPACEAYYPLIERVYASSTVPIRMVYRHFPLPQHRNAIPSARAAEAAALQGRFWEMYSLLFANHTQWTELSDPTTIFESYAERIGLNVPKFKTDLDSKAVTDAVDAASAEANRIGLFQTPTFFVNGKMIQNPQGYDAFKTAIESAAR
jgi:protein-disulfide isomerase